MGLQWSLGISLHGFLFGTGWWASATPLSDSGSGSFVH